MFKIIYLPNGYEYTVYFVSDAAVGGANFLVYDHDDGCWKWLHSKNCKPA